MKYLLLVYASEAAVDALEQENGQALWRGIEQCLQSSVARKEYLLLAMDTDTAALSLHRRSDGLILDVAENAARERLQGFVLLQTADIDSALRFAAGMPVAQYGCIEVRPIRELVPGALNVRNRNDSHE